MSKIGSKVVWFAGGTVLFAAAFVGVAMARGAALHDVPGLSWMGGQAPAPADGDAAHAPMNAGNGANNAGNATGHGADHAAGTAASSAAEIEKTPPRPSPQIPHLTAGVLGAFVMPAPFDARELQELEKRLKDGLARVAAEEERQKKRERDLDDWQNVLQKRADELSALRKAIEESGESSTADKAASAKSLASWRTLAPLFEEGDPSEVAVRLAQLEPDQAAQVLRGLDSDRAAALLNALPKERYKTYLDAWRRAGG